MYEIDRFAIEEVKMDGKLLMENAGRAIAGRIASMIDNSQVVLVLVGSGNNGGDGFVIARTLLKYGYTVTVLQLVVDEKITGDAGYHKQLFVRSGGRIDALRSADVIGELLKQADVIVDAMLGIGIKGPLRPPFDSVVKAINTSNLYTISVDIPSGVPADEVSAAFIGTKADYTFVLEAPKMSAFLQATAAYYGKWEVVDIGLPIQAFDSYQKRQVWGQEEFLSTLPQREQFSYKGSHGKGLVIGGSMRMPGSVALTTMAALRAGAGLITVGTVAETIPTIASQCAEAMYLPLTGRNGEIIDGSIQTSAYDAIVIGMGMGREKATGQFVRKLVSEAQIPVIIDADGIFHIKQEMQVLSNRKSATVLTPHVGEMSLLTGIPVSDILAKPFTISKNFASTYQVYLVLKGPFTIITDPWGRQTVSTSGNPGLAKGGSGDVLSGILLAMIMQDESLSIALSNGCYLHGDAADRTVSTKHSEQDLVATDVIEGLASVFRTFHK